MSGLKFGGRLPNSIPANLNNITLLPNVPHGSVGFTLVCRSARDFSTVLANVYDYVSMSYSEEVSGEGAGNVTLNMDDPLFLNQLMPGVTVENLLERDNLWEVYFDGRRKFQWLGQNVKESHVSSSEDRTIVISGPGIAHSLSWALVLPNRFPIPRPKIDTVRDDFSDDLDVNDTWINNGGTFSVGGKQLRLTVSTLNTPGSHIGTGINYDFVDSGVQVRAFPYLAPLSGPGHINTAVRIEAATSFSYVMMYVSRDFVTGTQRDILCAEISNGPGNTVRTVLPYDPVAHAFWRIQEADGVAIFSVRREDTGEGTWQEIARHKHNFDATDVRLRLQAWAEAGSNLTLPQNVHFSELSVNGVSSVFAPLESYRRLILKAQERGTIKFIVPTWTTTTDSVNSEWVVQPHVEAAIGADLLSVLNDYCEAQQADWIMGPDFDLSIRQRIWKTFPVNAPNPTLPFHKEDKVIFYEEDSQEIRERSRTYRDVRNYIVGKTSNDEYSYVKDDASIASFQQREEFVSDSANTRDSSSLRDVLTGTLEAAKKGVSSWSVKVPFSSPGRRVYQDYTLGDWIGVHVTFPHRTDAWKVVAISVSVEGDGDPELELTLDNKLQPHWLRLSKAVQNMQWKGIALKGNWR